MITLRFSLQTKVKAEIYQWYVEKITLYILLAVICMISQETALS